jgi:hypothetical protein
MKRRESLRECLAKIKSGRRKDMSGLDGCPEGGWPETRQAIDRLAEILPQSANRTYSLWDVVRALYTVDHAGRYRAL